MNKKAPQFNHLGGPLLLNNDTLGGPLLLNNTTLDRPRIFINSRSQHWIKRHLNLITSVDLLLNNDTLDGPRIFINSRSQHWIKRHLNLMFSLGSFLRRDRLLAAEWIRSATLIHVTLVSPRLPSSGNRSLARLVTIISSWALRIFSRLVHSKPTTVIGSSAIDVPGVKLQAY